MKVLEISSETSEGGLGISVREGAVPDRCDGYVISIQAGNSRGAGITRESGAGGECEYAKLDTANTLSLAQDHWYSLRVEAKGARIDVYLDGQLVLSGEDSDPILAGPLIVDAQPGVTIYYDDVRVIELVAETYLSQLRPNETFVGFGIFSIGKYGFDAVSDGVLVGDPVTTHGIEYSRGLYAHAPSRLTYALGGLYSDLQVEISLLDSIKCGDGAIFVVELDGNEIYRSMTMFNFSIPIEIYVDVARGQELRLITEEGPLNDNDCDWAIWGDPVLH
ncbi:MAG: NPCBM/NEW2 domain-containing protein [Anaerolineales bacterium]